jgi:hypothetical protein
MKRMSVRFGRLTADQQSQLNHLLKNFTTGEVPDEINATQARDSGN